LEATWNNLGQQSLGFLAAAEPALKLIYHNRPGDLAAAKLRALNFFNTNPVSSGLVIGAVLRLEEEYRDNLLDLTRFSSISGALASAMAAQGDRLFWQSWLPFCCLLACLTVCLTGHPIAALLVPVLYVATAWPIRCWGLATGYRMGGRVYLIIQNYHVNVMVWILSIATTLLLAVLTVITMKTALTTAPGPWWRFLLAAACVVAIVSLNLRLIFRRRSLTIWLTYPAVVAALILTAVLM
jgi:mannose/fructose/N-acetylgalactosamine-specific phosphotransferase system component IID